LVVGRATSEKGKRISSHDLSLFFVLALQCWDMEMTLNDGMYI